MRAVLQRVSRAAVNVNDEPVGEIAKGLLVLVGFTAEDNDEDFTYVIRKLLNMRIFNDEEGKMNLSVKDVDGELLVVSQFTLYAQTKKGNRPSYTNASKPELAKQQYETFTRLLNQVFGKKIEQGIFGADMQVSLLNNGPVTIVLDSKEKSV